jgi:hypothetical protein
VVGFFLHFFLSQHLDHLQQLDNLEHSAHLYGQLTTVGDLYFLLLSTVHTHEETYCYHKVKNNLHLKLSTN